MGFLFSLKATSASSLSFVLTTVSYAAFSARSPNAQPSTAAKAALIAIGPPSHISLASFTASLNTFFRAAPSCSKSSWVTSISRSQIPRKYASGAATRRPVRIKSRARDSPMSAGRRYVPPAPGMMASRVSGSATTALEPKTRRCVVRASSRPPPNAGAARAAMVGIRSREREAKVARREARKAAVLGTEREPWLVETRHRFSQNKLQWKQYPLFLGKTRSLLEIGARAKARVHLAGENQRPCCARVPLVVHALHLRAQLAEQLPRNRITRARPVQRQDSYPATMRRGDVGNGERGTWRRRVRAEGEEGSRGQPWEGEGGEEGHRGMSCFLPGWSSWRLWA